MLRLLYKALNAFVTIMNCVQAAADCIITIFHYCFYIKLLLFTRWPLK